MKTRKINLAILAAITFSVGMVSSCSKDDMETPTDTGSVTNATGKVEDIDKRFFGHIKYANDNSTKIWPEYDFSSYRSYYIFREKDDSAPLRGFLVNTTEKVPNAVEVAAADASGLKIYRYDNKIKDGNETLKKGNLAYDFNYQIEDKGHYLQAYNTDGVERNGDSSVELGFHEVFHVFQESWKEPQGYLQDEENYPINKALLPLQLLTVGIAKKMPAETNAAAIDKYLSMYVAIRSEEIRLDPSSTKLVKNMANPQEVFEGTAKYVDYTVGKGLFPNIETSYESFSFEQLNSKSQMRTFFGWGIWYGTGAAVTYMLNQKGVNVAAAVKQGTTLFDLASTTLNLTDAQKAEFLEQAKSEFNWTSLSQEADRLLALE